MSQRISSIVATEILDSRGFPTVGVEIELDSGEMGYSEVPSGNSTGEYEAVELRDGDSHRYRGKGVLTAVSNVNQDIKNEIIGKVFYSQAEFDQALISLDGTEGKWRLGANAMLGASVAFARAAAKSYNQPFFQYLSPNSNYSLPVPVVSLISGGVHADSNLDIEEFMIIPNGAKTFQQGLQMCAEVFHILGDLLRDDGYQVGVGDDGGYSPRLESLDIGFEFIMRSIEKAGYIAGQDISLGIDIAASELVEYENEDPIYCFSRSSGARYSALELINLYKDWLKYYPIISIEDGLSEHDWEGWQELTKQFGDRCLIVGDDVFVTNVSRIAQGVQTGVGNAVLIKPNQIGTLTETLEAISIARDANYKIIIGNRAGETCDSTIAEIAVSVSAHQLKAGSICRGERVAKYNKLLRIESSLGDKCKLISNCEKI
jgi:enolase